MAAAGRQTTYVAGTGATGALLGHITAEAAEHTGLPPGLPMIAASSDKACEVLGAGGIAPHIGCLSFGTTATISTTTSRYLETIPFIPPYTAAMPKRYNTEVMIYRGFWMVSWFKNELAQVEQRKAKELGIEPEQLFDTLLNQVPPGSMGLMMQPLLVTRRTSTRAGRQRRFYRLW